MLIHNFSTDQPLSTFLLVFFTKKVFYDATIPKMLICLRYAQGTTRKNCAYRIVVTANWLTRIPKEKVVESHGSFASATCKDCNKPYADMKHFWNQVEIGCIPRCMECNGERVKPDIVFFGEGLPARFTDLQDEDFKQCDLLIVAGTSLSVYPFAGLVNKVPPTTPRLVHYHSVNHWAES